MLTPNETHILQLLLELEQAVQAIREKSGKPDLASLFSRLDAATLALPRGTDPDLLHYLHKKSYEKARLWLEGRGAQNARGTCRSE